MKNSKKIFYALLSLPLVLLPSEAFIGFWIMLHPETFWQKLLLIALGSMFLSVLQIWFLFFWVLFIFSLS